MINFIHCSHFDWFGVPAGVSLPPAGLGLGLRGTLGPGQCPAAAITGDYTLEQQKCVRSQLWRPGARGHWATLPLRVWTDAFQASCRSEGASDPGSRTPHPRPSLLFTGHRPGFLLHLCVRTPVIGFRAPSLPGWPQLNSFTSAMILFPNEGTF